MFPRVSAVIPTDMTVISVLHNAETGNIVLQMSSGKLLQFNTGVSLTYKFISFNLWRVVYCDSSTGICYIHC